jgi:predicted O-methyltransferase YrrM
MFEGINSLITEMDATDLRKLGELVKVDGVCVEIGSNEGASAVEILKGLPERYDLVCASLHQSVNYPKFKWYCVQNLCWNRVLPITGDFRILPIHVEMKRLAFLFLDHDHSDIGMRDALNMLLPLCVSGTILSFHDYKHPGYPAVQKYVDPLIRDKSFRSHLIRDGLVILEKV